ncbi:MAG: response regulator [Bacteroidota bacterium]
MKKKILIAEDDESAKLLVTTYVKMIGCDFIVAKNGLEAVELYRKNPDVDLILMDIKMPEMNGHEATKEIRQFDKDIVIIAQTAFAMSGDKEKALESGCNDYISKPYTLAKLTDLIEKYLNN